jgi:hypothetical protein
MTLSPLPDDDANAERLRRARESRLRYRLAHPDRVRRTIRENRARKRVRLKAEESRRARDRARARAWAAEHPDLARERKELWSQQNSDRRREHQRNYYVRHQEERQRAGREQNTRRRQDPAQREREGQYQAERREHRTTQQRARRSSPETRDRLNAEQNERRQRERRRQQLGLPSRRPHRATTNEREANQLAADAFFGRRRGTREIELLREERLDVRVRASQAPGAFWQDDLRAQVRLDAAKPALIRAAVDELLSSRAGRLLREEVRLDSIARQVRGTDPFPDADAEARRRVLLEARHAKLTAPARPAPDPASMDRIVDRPALAL